MKAKFPETKRKRIILIYSLAIVLPGILMGVMAYQGILNDQARREKENRKQLSGIAEDFFYAMDSLLAAELNGINKGDSKSVEFPDYIRLAFIQTDKPDIELIHHHLNYITDSIESSFSDQEDLSLMSLLAKARNYKKNRQFQDALNTWKTIEKEFSNFLISNKIPAILVSQLEQIKILQHEKNEGKTAEALKIIYNTLLDPPVTYEASQYRFFLEELDNLQIPLDYEIQILKDSVIRRGEETDFLIRMISERDPVFLLNKQDPAWPGINKFPLENGSIQSLYLSIDQLNKQRLGCLIDIKPFVKAKTELIQSDLDPESYLDWQISDSINQDYTAFPFSEYYPKMFLNLKSKNPGFFSSSGTKGQGLYILIFVFIAGLMILGLVFTIYTINHELKLNRLKSDFISNVSHELKSPLTSIRHLTDLLDKDRVKNDNQKKKYYSTMLEQTEHLSYLIDNILDFSRLEDHRKKFRFQNVDYEALLSKWIGGFTQRLDQRGIELTRDIPDNLPDVRLDPDAIQQVVQNLLDNAIKYSGDGSKIEIKVSLDGKNLITSIQDHGIGISKKDQEKIFDRFYRCEESHELGIKGSGIGLTIVQRVVAAHNGSIKLISAPGKGSNFTVTLPVNQDLNYEENSTG